ncbi:MAG: U32 family peptidase [Elusimicrobia bacterium]|nr:U32 family peptidase [Elusimicrobiota bacterium]
MKIQVGVGSHKELDYFLSHGADEFYCGFSKIPSQVGYIRGDRNFHSIEDIRLAVKTAHKAGKEMFFVANEVYADFFDKTVKTIKTLIKKGIDGVIIKDLAILAHLHSQGIKTKIILSTLTHCFNIETVEFYNNFNIARIALPEQLTAQEAWEIIKNKFGIKTEIFLKSREYCVNFNGLCFLQFGRDKECFCRKKFKLGKKDFFMFEPSAHEQLGQLYDFYNQGAEIIKIGRSPDKESGKIFFREAVQLLKILKRKPSRADFIKEALKIKKAFDKTMYFLKEKGKDAHRFTMRK